MGGAGGLSPGSGPVWGEDTEAWSVCRGCLGHRSLLHSGSLGLGSCCERLAEETDEAGGGSVPRGSLDRIKYLLCFVLFCVFFFPSSIDQRREGRCSQMLREEQRL